MTITDRLLTPGAEHGRAGQPLMPKGITAHYVGNPGSSAEANRGWFENGAGGARASAHYIIGLNGEILRLIPENERAMHAGKSYGAAWDITAPTNNASYIGIECCHPDASGKFNDNTYAALIELCADICARYGFDPLKSVVRHYDITGKICPLYYVKNPYEWERLLVSAAIASHNTSGAAHADMRGAIAGAAADASQAQTAQTAQAAQAAQAQTAQITATLENMLADGVTTEENRAHWAGYLSGQSATNPDFVKTIFDRYHALLKGGN